MCNTVIDTPLPLGVRACMGQPVHSHGSDMALTCMAAWGQPVHATGSQPVQGERPVRSGSVPVRFRFRFPGPASHPRMRPGIRPISLFILGYILGASWSFFLSPGMAGSNGPQNESSLWITPACSQKSHIHTYSKHFHTPTCPSTPAPYVVDSCLS